MGKPGFRDDEARHRIEVSPVLQALFDGPIPGLASADAVEAGAFASGFRPNARILVSEWADEHRYLEGLGASEPGKWRTSRTPYMREIMDNMSSKSPVWKQSLVAGAQVSKTESGNNCIGYWASSAPGAIMFVLPKVGTAQIVSEQRIGPMFRNTECISKRLVKDLQLRKILIGGMLVFASARSVSDLKSTPIRYLVLDEVDEYPLDLDGQGSPVDLAIERTNTFRNKRKIFLTSTTTSEATSQIWAHWLEGDMRLYHMPCPHCRKLIVFEFTFEGGKGGLKWDWGNAAKTVHYECPECEGKIYERHKTKMLAEGVWVPTRKDLSEVEEGVRSYRLPSLYSPVGWKGWDEIAVKWEESYNVPSQVAMFRNTVLALPSVEVSEKVDWETVYTRGDVGIPYDLGQVPPGVLFLTAGADVGKDHIHISVWGWGRDRKRWLVDHVKIEGRSTQLPDLWLQAADAVHRTYKDSQGVEFGISRFFIDTGAWPEIVKPWIRQQNQQVVVGCDGLDHLDQPVKIVTQAEPVRGMPGKKTNVGALRIAQVGVSLLKAELLGVLSIPRPEDSDEAPAAWVHMPKQGLTKDMAKELVAERKVIERDANGRITGTRWERVESRRAEMLDCHNYARAAASLVGWDRFKDRDFERWEGRIAAAAAELKSHAEAEARGAPVAVAPQAQVGVTPRRPTAVRPAQPAPDGKALPRTAPQTSTFGVTTARSEKRVVPMPKVLSEE